MAIERYDVVMLAILSLKEGRAQGNPDIGTRTTVSVHTVLMVTGIIQITHG
jgi:hypothetical protein